MLSDFDKNQIKAGMSQMYSLLAGDEVTYYDSATATSGTNLLTLRYDIEDKKRQAEGDQGVGVTARGVEELAYQELLFLKPYLISKGVELKATGHFMIAGERWDFAKEGPIRDCMMPIAGIQDIVTARIRKATEVNLSGSGQITYGDYN